jgi:hypothetical protein
LLLCRESIEGPPCEPKGAKLPTIEPRALVVNFTVTFLAAVLGFALNARSRPKKNRFGTILLVAFALFGFVTFGSYFLRSDGFGLPGVADGNRLLGFPMVVCRQGGWANLTCVEGGRYVHTTVEPRALAVNFGVALAAALLGPPLYRRAKGERPAS